MGDNLKTYILVTEKAWHDALFDELKSDVSCRWIRMSDKSEFTVVNISRLTPDKIFIPHWSYIIPPEIFEAFECIVFHMTDLPFGRGGSPLQNLIVRGFDETKISALRVSAGVDQGDIYLKRSLSLHGTAYEIFKRAGDIISGMIQDIIVGDIRPVPQSGEAVEFKRRTRKDGDIAALSELKSVYDYIRMLDCEDYPKAFLETEYFIFEFTNARLGENESLTANVRITKK